MQPGHRPSSQVGTWQRRMMVTLGTLVVIVAALAVGLVIRNALGNVGLTGPSPTSEPPPSTPQTAVASTSTPATDTTGATTQPPTTSPTTTLTTQPALPPPPATFVEETIGASQLRLQPEGLGPIPFGTGVDRTLSVLAGALGSPDADTGWLPAEGEQLQCPGSRARAVTWGSLRVLFSDGPTDWGTDLHEHFFSYVYSLPDDSASPVGPSLRTSEGLQLGATLERAVAIYGEPSVTRGEPDGVTFLEVDVPGPGYLRGVFTGPFNENYLLSLEGGMRCGS